MTLDDLQRLAITVYFELILVHPEMQAEYIKQQFPTEGIFWDTIESTNVKLPYLVK